MTEVRNPFIGSVFAPNEDTSKLRQRFAMALLKNPDQPFVAAQEVFGSDTGKALYASMNWLQDDVVIAEQARLLQSKGARAFLPSKEDYAREVWRLAQHERTPVEDKRHLFSLFGDIMGYKTTPEKGGVNVNITQNKVMFVKDHGSDDDWERAAMTQQARLQQGAVDVPSRVVN